MTFILKQLSSYDNLDIYNMLQRIGANEYEFTNPVHGMTYDEFLLWLKMQQNWSRGIQLPPGYVRQWIFWFINDNVPIGFGKIREKVTKQSILLGGNIGYAIDPIHRGKGYGKILFNLLLDKAKQLSVFEIYSTVEKDNIPSYKIHIQAGMHIWKDDIERWYFKNNFS